MKSKQMKRLVLISLLLAIFINPKLISQTKFEIKNNFYDAESWILFEDFKEALPKYQELLKLHPDNSNLKYRIGQCYINIPGEKEKAIGYLEDAVKNINPKYKEGKFRENSAPYDALYYLANAYRINNQIDKAIETYKLFEKNLDPEVYDSVIVNLQIKSCFNAKELMAKPLFVREKNIGNIINETNSEFNPVISDDENMLVFSKSKAFYDAILYSTKTNGQWTSPLNMNELLKVDRDFFPTSLSKDGKDLFLYSSVDYDGIIYTARIENGVWSLPIKLNDNINTKYWESHATISHDNKKLYFTSNRKGGFGGLDIYVSEKDSTGDWGPPVNLGSVINTPYNEDTPFLSKDDKTLFFSSRGHFNMGGYDIFYSSLLENGQWSVPLNAGYPLNSTDDDVFFKPLNEGYEGYFAKYDPDGYGKQDIYRIEIFSENHPRKFYIKGIVTATDLISNLNERVKISTVNMNKPGKTLVIYSNPKTGEYEFQATQGNYEVTYEAAGTEKTVKKYDFSLLNPSDTIILPLTKLPKTDFIAELEVGSNKNISVTNGNPIVFPLKVEPGSVLTVEHWLGDKLISTEQFNINSPTFNYKMIPLPGENKIVFKLTDRFNNITTTEVFVTRQKEVINQAVIKPEYSRVIADKQITVLTEMLKNRADDNIRKVIDGSDIKNQKFQKVDDVISYIKGEAAKSDISGEEIDKLALKVAMMDNVLTQAAVNLLTINAEGDLKTILSDLDIYDSNLKTWSDLQEYVSEKSGGKIKPEDLNKLASEILAEADPAIAKLKEKIFAYSDKSESGSNIINAVTKTELKNIKIAGKWLQSVYSESIKQGLNDIQLSDMFAAISTMPDTDVKRYADDLSKYAEEPLLSWLKSLDLKKGKIKSPEDLVLFIIRNKDKGIYPEEEVFNSLAGIIASKDIPADIITSSMVARKGHSLWYLWVIFGTGLLFLLFIFLKRRKKIKE